MSERLQKVINISEHAHSSQVEIWTNTFKATGSLFKRDNEIVEGVVTLKNAKVYPIFNEDSKCSCTSVEREWLNIFEDKIIAFTVI